MVFMEEMETVCCFEDTENKKVFLLLQWLTETSAAPAEHWQFHTVAHQEIIRTLFNIDDQ